MQQYKTRRIQASKYETVTLFVTDNTDNRCLVMITVITTKNVLVTLTLILFNSKLNYFLKKSSFLTVLVRKEIDNSKWFPKAKHVTQYLYIQYFTKRSLNINTTL